MLSYFHNLKSKKKKKKKKKDREFYSMLYGDLNGKNIQKRGDISICIADSLCYTAENKHNIVKQLSSNKN